MLTSFQETLIQFGNTDVGTFNSTCYPGDWQDWQIQFSPSFPRKPRVIITAHDQDTDPQLPLCPVVGVARNVTETGFTLAARNPQPDGGQATLYWLALLETPGVPQFRNELLRMGTMDPRLLSASQWVSWTVRFSEPKLGAIPAIFLTASNLFAESGSFRSGVAFQEYKAITYINHNAAAAGVVREPKEWAFELAAYNTDCAEGYSNFQYLALAKAFVAGVPPEGQTNVWVNTGWVPPKSFAPTCEKGDWNSWYVWFDQAFLTPPTVLVTANNLNVANAGNPAVVGIAQYVTPNGFRLAARNSDCGSGLTGFYWVAIGCVKGCG